MHFFLVGFPRSGTTLLATLLSRHSKIFVPPETRFYEELLPKVKAHRLLGFTTEAEAVKASINFTRAKDLSSSLAEVSEPPRGAQWLPYLIRRSRYYKNEEMIGEKSPVHMLHLPQILRDFPAAKIIVITRKFGNCMESLQRMPWAKWPETRFAKEYKYRFTVALRLADAEPERFHFVQFEQLIANTPGTVRLVCDALGLAYENTLLDTTVDVSTVPLWEAPWKRQSAGEINAHKLEGDGAVQRIEEDYCFWLRPIYIRLGYTACDVCRMTNDITANAAYGIFRALHPLRKKLKYYVYALGLERKLTRHQGSEKFPG